jgi:hypothetical protein
MAAAALLRWRVPGQWFGWLTAAGAILSIGLQVTWFTEWAVLPLMIDAALLWIVLRMKVSVEVLRA